MPRITLEDTPALSELTDAGHLYLVLRQSNEADGVGLVIRGGKAAIAGLLEIQTTTLGDSDDEYETSDTESTRHARDITAEVGLGSWSAMVAHAQGIDGVYDYELPLASGDRFHVGVGARTLDARPTSWPRMAEKRAFGD